MEKIVEFLKLVKYSIRKGVQNNYNTLYFDRNLHPLPGAVEWCCELHEFISNNNVQATLEESLKKGWGVDRTVDFLSERIPFRFISPFLRERSIGIGYSASFFFRNFYPCINAHIRFVRKYNKMTIEEFERFLVSCADKAQLKDLSGMVWWVSSDIYYYFVSELKHNAEITITYETMNFKKTKCMIKVTDKYNSETINYRLSNEANKKITEILRENLRSDKIDREVLKEHLSKLETECCNTRFEHIIQQLKKLTV